MLGVQTLPNATCVLQSGETTSTAPMKLFAADSGVVHFSIEMDNAGTVQLELNCTDNNGASRVVTISVSAEVGAPDINNDPTVTLPDVGVVQEPLGADPMSITPEQLTAAGYPRRPDPSKYPKMFAAWSKMVTSRNTRVTTNLVPRPNEPKLNPPQNGANHDAVVQTGFIFGEANGEWNIPPLVPPYPYQQYLNQTAGDASWVGVQGDGGVIYPTVLAQAGVIQYISCTSYSGNTCGAITRTNTSFSEYVPAYWAPLGITVTDGDEVYVDVYVCDVNGTYDCNGGHMHVIFYDLTSRAYGTWLVQAPAGTSMNCASGQQAEFCLEWYGGVSGGYLFGDWSDDWEMYGFGWDFSGNVVPITDSSANTLWDNIFDSSNPKPMAAFWPDYTNDGIVFQWFRLN